MAKVKLNVPGAMNAILTGLFKGQLTNIILALLLIGSAFVLIIQSHEQRQLYAELEKLEQQRDQLDIEWRELRLEQRVMAEHSRLETIAKEKIGLVNLDLKSERIVRRVKDD